MLFLAGAALISAAFVLVVVARRMASSPDASRWLKAAVLGNTLALLVTTLLASGAAVLMQAAISRADAVGVTLAVLGAILPYVGFRIAIRGSDEARGATAALPPAGGDRSVARRGRTDPRPASAGEASLASRTA